MNAAWVDLVGMLAATLTTIAYFPQAVKTIRTRNTSGISIWAYTLLLCGVTMWMVYGIILGSWPLILANAIVLVPQSLVMTILLRQHWAK